MKAVEMGRCFSVLASLSQYFQSPDCVSHSKNLVAGLDEPPPVDVFLVLLIIFYWLLMLVKVLWKLVGCVKGYLCLSNNTLARSYFSKSVVVVYAFLVDGSNTEPRNIIVLFQATSNSTN